MITIGAHDWRVTKPELIRLPKEHQPIGEIGHILNPACTKCPLHLSTHNVCVMGRGNKLNPLIMMVGEAPGQAEAEYGEPFRGRSGQLILQPTIDEFGLMPFTYITNICKCRPPANRKPEPDEMQTCANSYLRKELHLLNPMILVLLGNTAIESFKTELTAYYKHELHLARILGRTRLILPTWHPAYCLRSGKNITNQFKKALSLVRQVLERNGLV